MKTLKHGGVFLGHHVDHPNCGQKNLLNLLINLSDCELTLIVAYEACSVAKVLVTLDNLLLSVIVTF